MLLVKRFDIPASGIPDSIVKPPKVNTSPYASRISLTGTTCAAITQCKPLAPPSREEEKDIMRYTGELTRKE